MYLSKRHIARRTFLRGAGITLALPLLDSMIPAATALAQTAAVPKSRFMGIFFPHGMAPGSWVPDQPILTAIGQRFMQHLRTRMVAVRFIRCDGYTATWLPSPAFPPTLSLQRARVVCASLKRGGGTARVRLVPHGLTDPIASNSTEAGRRINRRVGRNGRQPHDRSTHRPEDGPGNAAAVASAGGRGSELELEQLR